MAPRTCQVEFRGDVAILKMENGENRFNSALVPDMLHCLDQIEQNEDCRVLITTGSGKFYSNGMDLKFMEKCSPEQLNRLLKDTQDLLFRILTFPMLTVAAINGHAYAAGAFLAMVHDKQVMGSDRGWYCLNEVHTGIPFSPFYRNLYMCKLSPPARHEVAVLGERYTADEAFEAGLISRVAGGMPEHVLPQTIKLAKEVLPAAGYNRQFIKQKKEDLYGWLKPVELGEETVLDIVKKSKL